MGDTTNGRTGGQASGQTAGHAVAPAGVAPAGRHPSLLNEPADLIAGQWVVASSAAPALRSHNPARPAEVVWAGRTDAGHVDRAVRAARGALPVWSRLPIERRAAVLRRAREVFARREPEIVALLRDEVGKVTWDAKAEAGILAGKIDITLDDSATGPLRRVTGFETALSDTRAGRCWFRPHGVMAVVGPFNFPMHLPNGHIAPALLMGNTVVFKPSDKTPGCGQLLAEIYDEALRAEDAPPGVLNLVQGAADVASRLVTHDELDGILFTGSWPVGRRIMEANLDRPGRVLALEMGGNNAAVIMPDADLRQAVIECVRSAFLTTGQRCTCTRRVVVHEDVADRVIPAIAKAATNLIVGPPDAAHPVFMGPLVSRQARQMVLDAQRAMQRSGGESLVECAEVAVAGAGAGAGEGEGWYCSPGVMRVERFVRGGDVAALGAGADVEVFGPLLRVSVARDADDAIEQANATDYGLAASIFTKDAALIERFLGEARAGCVNVNTGTAGASSKLPFGGLGLSGNHRPAGAFSLDYCAYPVAGMLERGAAAQVPTGMRFDDGWLT